MMDTQSLNLELCKMLGVDPADVRVVELRIAANEAPRLTVVRDDPPITKTYRLRDIVIERKDG